MEKTKRATLIWSLAAVMFSLIGVYTALTSGGTWSQVVTAVVLLLAGVVFGAKAILAARTAGLTGRR